MPQADGEWTEKVLYSFNGSGRGSIPTAGLIFDADGNLYGTTLDGGTLQRRDGVRVDARTRAGTGRRRCCITSTATARTGLIPKPA